MNKDSKIYLTIIGMCYLFPLIIGYVLALSISNHTCGWMDSYRPCNFHTFALTQAGWIYMLMLFPIILSSVWFFTKKLNNLLQLKIKESKCYKILGFVFGIITGGLFGVFLFQITLMFLGEITKNL